MGHKIELYAGDSGCVPAPGVTAAQRLINENKVQIIIGDICSSVTLALMPVVAQNQIILLNAASSNPDITYQAGVGGNRWIYRNYPTDEQRALVTFKFAIEQEHRTKFAALAVDNDYGRGAITYTKKYLPQFPGVQIVSEDYYKDTETDFRSVLSKIKSEGVQGIIFYGYMAGIPALTSQMKELGMGDGKFPLFGAGDFTLSTTIRQTPAGVLNNSAEGAAYQPDFPNAETKLFVSAYEKMWQGEVPSQQHAYNHWSTLRVLAQAITMARSTNNDDIRKALSNGTFTTPMGQIKFDDHNQADTPMLLIEVVNGAPALRGTLRATPVYPK